MVKLFGYEIVIHTNNFTSVDGNSMIKIHRENLDTYVFIGRRMAVIVSKIDKTSKGGRGIP